MEEKNAALDWLELMAGRGIGALAQKMQRQGGKKLFITGRQGIEHYPQSGVVAPQVVLDMLAVMPDFDENQYYYAKNQQTLVFKVILDDMPDSVLFIFWQQTENEDIAPLSGMLESARLALKWYLRGHKAFAKRLHEQRAAFFEGVFVKHNISVESMLAEQGIELHHDRKYAVMLMDMGADMPLIPPADFRAKLLQFSQRYQTDLIYPLEWNGIYLVILSGLYVQQELGLLSLKKRQELFARWQQLFAASTGAGSSREVYMAENTHRVSASSFCTARLKKRNTPSSFWRWLSGPSKSAWTHWAAATVILCCPVTQEVISVSPAVCRKSKRWGPLISQISVEIPACSVISPA